MGLDMFTQDELEVKRTVSSRGGEIEFFNTPITSKENLMRLYAGKTPMWIPFTGEEVVLKPDCDPEVVARSHPEGGIDGWGVPWVFEPNIGGAISLGGNPIIKDLDHWEDYTSAPNPDEWDWEGCVERQGSRREDDRVFMLTTSSCMFERLIALMDFENAAMALIDDDSKEALHRLLRANTDARKKYYTKMKEYFNPDLVNFNDDWGAQKAEFFSVDTAKEMLVPYVKEIVEHVHSLGLPIELHCCGFVEHFVPLFIEEGFDSWGGQPINDKFKLKKQYGDKLIFSQTIALPKDYTDEELTDKVEEYMREFGFDNRVLMTGPITDKRLHRALYEASRRNYDRLVAEGKAIL